MELSGKSSANPLQQNTGREQTQGTQIIRFPLVTQKPVSYTHLSSFYNILMRDCFLRIWFAIQCNTIYIFMFFRQILSNNRESLAIGQMQSHLRQLWSTEYILRTYRIYRIEYHRTKHIDVYKRQDKISKGRSKIAATCCQ